MNTARDRKRADVCTPQIHTLMQQQGTRPKVRQGTANTGGRPRGEIREALTAAAVALQAESGGGTWLDLMQRAAVSRGLAQATLKSMVRSGQLQIIDHRPHPKTGRRLNVYALAVPAAPDSAVELSSVLAAWFAK